MIKKTFLALGLLAIALGLQAQSLSESVSFRLNKEGGVYQEGETVKIWADVKSVPADEITFAMFEYGDKPEKLSKTVKLKAGENLVFEGKYDQPTHFVCKLSNGKDNSYNPKEIVKVGFIVSPESFSPGFTAPVDLDEFWAKEIAGMRKMPIESKVITDKSDSKYTIQDVEVNCVGPSPLKGYIAGRGTPIVPADPSAVIDTSLYINPIPTGLVLTGIVVSVSVTAFFLSLTVRLYEDYNTVRIDEILIKIHAKEEKKAKGVHEE